jgi:Fe-S-cluster containining protein
MAHPQEEQMRLFDQAERWFDRSRAALLGQVPCHRGCHRCCIGPFAITIIDTALLQEGLAELDQQESRYEINERAKRQTAIIEQEFPRLARSAFLDDWPDLDVDRLVSRFADLPCPALDAEGSCLVYRFRPLTSPTMGLPVQTGDRTHGACEVQTAVPIVPLSRTLRIEDRLATLESAAIASHRRLEKVAGEEMLLPYGLLPDHRPDHRSLDQAES